MLYRHLKRAGGPGLIQANHWVPHLRDGFIVAKVGIAEFPKWESLKNKSGKSGMFFEPEK